MHFKKSIKAVRALNFLPALCCLCLTAGALAQQKPADAAAPPREWEGANQLYAQGKYAEAKREYDSLVRAGNWSSLLFFNLGDAEWRLGHAGAAALNYERALALDPALPEARANLQFVQSQTGAKLDPARWPRRFFPDWGAGVSAVLAALGGWAALFCLAAGALRSRPAETGGLWLGAACGALLCAYALGAIFFLEKNRALAVVTATRAEARFAPADSAPVADTLPTASRVRVLQDGGAWTYVELPGGARAWVAANAIERVSLPL